MKLIYTFLLSLFYYPSICQEIEVKGVVKDKVSQEPLPFVFVAINTNKDSNNVQSNFDGEFTCKIQNFNSLEILINYVGYNLFDTTINSNNITQLTLLLERNVTDSLIWIGIGKGKALDDINKNKILLYMPSGFITPTLLPEDTLFENKYSVEYTSTGCIKYNGDNLPEYNATIATYLDKKYGNRWRKKVRKDIVGLRH
jgi:hypothetical protein